MQKRKSGSNKSKVAKVTKLNPVVNPASFFESLIDDIAMEDRISNIDDKAMSQFISSAISGAIDLTKLVIENRKHNAEKMHDNDIYDIYAKSIKAIFESAENLEN